ncbi:SGNH/GDSL hydrolase family protein [Actinomadura macrotermitis]|uniref:SGNH hydrolase-type esterase domain-containing protein n=1 Tax=Actinomadura macrotermitis TaxID=2585200 RepID=A0A7K0BYC7_9ACTN|nr:SGNH/GDSL hydrolase family protein [Actinomadura macrotermitis]MQY05634.1 hypothetical protein [Actinomadura macrotermitis]
MRPDTERLVRYMRPERSLPFLGGAGEDRLAAVFGLEPAAYRRCADDLSRRARDEALQMLADPGFADQVGRLPFEKGETVLAVGESDTADRLSWLEMLRHLLDERHGAGAVTVVNAAVSGQTTTEALGRWTGVLRQTGPVDRVVCKLGTNDTRSVGGTTLVGAHETLRNLGLLRTLAPVADARWVWMTPHPVDERRIAAHPSFGHTGSAWRNDDIAAVAEGIRRRPEPVVDLAGAFRPGDDPLLLGPDGLHPTPAGQRAVLAALVRALADGPMGDTAG